MSPDELTQMAELTDLARDLDNAGRRADAALPRDMAREQEILGRLRAQLIGERAGAEDTEPVHTLTPLRPIVRVQLPGVRISRSMAAGLAACLAIVAMLAAGSSFWLPAPLPGPATVVDEAARASLVRNGKQEALAAGIEVRQGDQIHVLDGGTAALSLGNSRVRLGAGAAVTLVEVSGDRIDIDQTAGRVFYRLVAAHDTVSVVTTDGASWKAGNSALDLDRHSTASGGGEVRGLVLQNDVSLSGPGLSAELKEGTSATIQLGPGSTGSLIEPIASALLDDPWLQANARKDAQLGLPLGWLASLAATTPQPTGTATPTGTVSPTDAPPASPIDSMTPGPTPTPVGSTSAPTSGPTTAKTRVPPATSRPTTAPITPTSTPTAAPTPAPVDMGPLSVTKNANGTYTISWNAYSGPLAITSYALCYTTNENASFGYVEKFGGVIGVSKTATSWTGTFPWAATLKVKIEALYYPPSAAAQKAGETQIVVIPYTAPTSTATPTPPAVVSLGDFVTAHDNGDGTFTFGWTGYTGPLSVAYMISGTTTAGGTFGYFEDGHYWSDANPSDQTWTGPVAAGSWRIKVEAISTSTGTVIKAAETTIYFLTVP